MRFLTLFLVAALALPGEGWARPRAEVYFSPRGGCANALVRLVGSAKRSLRVQVYYFTSAIVADALIEAGRRGVDVRVIVDKSQVSVKSSVLSRLAGKEGIHIYVDRRHKIQHNKVFIADRVKTATGSFNPTDSAEDSNAENLLILEDGVVAGEYERDWLKHQAHSLPFPNP